MKRYPEELLRIQREGFHFPQEWLQTEEDCQKFRQFIQALQAAICTDYDAIKEEAIAWSLKNPNRRAP